jgi:repressor LexA
MAISNRQREILEFVAHFQGENGYPPTIREIGSAVGISSTSHVSYHLRALREKGYLEKDPHISRGLRVVGESRETVSGVASIPLLGVIAAGDPIPIPDDERPLSAFDTLELARDILPRGEGIYALQVQGDSMIDALINDGDIVVMQHQRIANNGDMVAAWLKNERETTLKRFYLEGHRVRLQPENPRMAPIYVHPAEVEIQGKVVLVIRQVER